MYIAVPPVPGNTVYRLPNARKAPPLTYVDNALLFLSPQSRSPDHTWELTKLLLEGETLLEFNRLRGRIVPRKSLFKQGFMAEEKIQQVIAVYEKHGRPRFNPPSFDAVTRVLNQATWDIVRDRKLAPREGLNNLARELDQLAQEAGFTGDTRV
jgi:hypothetical protein